MATPTLADRLDALLPQTQCTKCGFEGCQPYAQAMAEGNAAPNRCPPGGEAGAAQLAALLGVPPLPLDTSRGLPGPLTVARIDEAHCIGCTLCIQACPVDAIVGAPKFMHTVLADRCTGCDLCVPPCPVDCIDMVPALNQWTPDRAQVARQHHLARQQRLISQHTDEIGPVARNLSNKAPLADTLPGYNDAHRHQTIVDALARARSRRQHHERR